MDAKLPLIGRERALIEKLAKLVYKVNLPNGTLTTKLREAGDQRGFYFDVNVPDADGNPSGCIARVEIKLNRVEYEKE